MAIELFEVLCDLCKHAQQGLRCAAYPDRIPLEIREMHVDHRQPYAGDHGITFEPKDDSEQTRQRLQQVRLRPGRIPTGPNDLDRRISRIWKKIPFADPREQYRFIQAVKIANRFEELPEWCQTLILRIEARDAEMENGSRVCEAG